LEIYKYKSNKDSNYIGSDDLDDIYTVIGYNAIESQQDEKKDDGFKVAGPKKPKEKKSTTDSYLKKSGQGQNIGFDACERKMEVYLGRDDLKVDKKSVEEYVKKL
ncbi:unnamed protein product, partial [Brachionus calyciflorus]